MAIEIFMPALSPTMEEGTLAAWLVKEGDSIAPGDVIAEIETDKATMEVESIDEGTVGKIIIEAGTDNVKVGALIAVLLEEGEDASAIATASEAPAPTNAELPAPPPPPQSSPSAGEDVKVAQHEPASSPSPALGEGREGGISVSEDITAGEAPVDASGNRILASPLARRIAKQKELDLAQIAGTGPKGRIVKADVVNAQPVAAPAKTETKAALASVPAAAPDYGPPADVPYEEVKLPGMRKVIAKRMTESKSTVPHFYLTVDCELDALLALRKDLNAKLADEGVKLSVNDFVIRAAGLALKKVPAANAQFAGDKMYRFQRADISVAVAIEGGLITPVVKGACSKGLREISEEMKTLAAKARDGKLMPEEYQGGTFSISNLGMYGIKEFDAVINPPQGAILAVAAGEKRPVVKDDALAIATVMSVTLSVDHRVLDGAIGSEFLAAFKGYVQDPLTMLL
ncbi:MAG: pyruvate dehydrogenase complex dihydrolipoamide acetyltransferase [Pseudomonadota bacterium]